jgi:hypothetical protein
MLPLALPRSRVRIITALAFIAACNCALVQQESDFGQADKLNSLDEAIVNDGSVVDAAAAASGKDEAMATWARKRVQELQQQRDHEAVSPESHRASAAHENLDFQSMLNVHSDSAASPEDIRNLFYSDAARAEVTPLSRSEIF